MFERQAALLGLMVLLLAPAVPALRLDSAVESAVLVTSHFTLRGPGGEEKVYVSQGSGWTASCRRVPDGYRILVRTGAHVVDPAESVALPGLDGSWRLVDWSYHLRYRDRFSYEIPPQAVSRAAGDSATLEFLSPRPRSTLPLGAPAGVQPGDRLWTVACSDGLCFLATDGVLSATLADAGVSPPPDWEDDWWLSTLPAVPGSSGAPVLDDRGQVVAHIVGRLEWPGGALSILQPEGVTR